MKVNRTNERIRAHAALVGITCVRTFTYLQKCGKRKVKFYHADASPSQLDKFEAAMRKHFSRRSSKLCFYPSH